MLSLRDTDTLSRFAYDRKNHVRPDGTAHHSLLKPKAGQALSVFHTTDMAHSAICDHGHNYADNQSSGRIHFGYVTIRCDAVRAEGLHPIYDNSSPRHVSVPFNTDEPESRLALAKALARRASKLQECTSQVNQGPPTVLTLYP